jgi:hypothetical protein
MPRAYVLVRTQHTSDYTKPIVKLVYNLHNKSGTTYKLDPSLQWSESAPLRDPVPPRQKHAILAAGTVKNPGVDIQVLRASYIRGFLYEELRGRVCVEMRDAMSQGALGLQWYGDIAGFHTGGHMRCAANSSQSKERHVWWDILETTVDLE